MSPSRLAFLATLLAAGAAAAADPQRMAGPAVALYGDTLLVAGQRARLFGIDVPPLAELPHGPYARAALDDLVADAAVDCAVVGKQDSLPVVVCATPTAADLGEALIRAGRAIPARIYTHAKAADAERARRYDEAEREARRLQKGLWLDYVE